MHPACDLGFQKNGDYAYQKAVREEVVKRDGGCCAYVGTDGRRCSEMWDIEFEHIVPHALGGANTTDNLMLLCRAHNQYRARVVFGEQFIADKIRSHGSNKRDDGNTHQIVALSQRK